MAGWLKLEWRARAPVAAPIAALTAALVLAACGGGGDGPPQPPPAATVSVSDPNAPQVTGNTATDAVNRFNYRRQQAGLAAVTRNARIDAAAQGHSDYQKLNNQTTHVQQAGRPGFTGAQLADRFAAAGYALPANDYAYGEVISLRSDASGASAAEDLLAAIYHRFIVLEPMYKEVGAGAATTSAGSTYLTADFAAIGLDAGLARSSIAVYPFAGQADVPAVFFSDSETPDPVPGQNQVGYPVSVHANLVAPLAVQSLTVSPRGGAALSTRLLTSATDAETPVSAAAAIPLSPLSPATTYDVRFVGTVAGVAVDRSWSFTTQ